MPQGFNAATYYSSRQWETGYKASHKITGNTNGALGREIASIRLSHAGPLGGGYPHPFFWLGCRYQGFEVWRGLRVRALGVRFPRLALQSRCAGSSGPIRCPPSLSCLIWSAVKLRAWVGGSVVSMGRLQIQQGVRCLRVWAFSLCARSTYWRWLRPRFSGMTLWGRVVGGWFPRPLFQVFPGSWSRGAWGALGKTTEKARA